MTAKRRGAGFLRLIVFAAVAHALASGSGFEPTATAQAASKGADRSDLQTVPDEMIVRFEPGVDGQAAAHILGAVGAETEEKLPVPGLRLAEVRGYGTTAHQAIGELQAKRKVAYAEPNFIRRLDATPNDDFYPELWGLENHGQAVLGTPGVVDADIDAAAGWDFATSTGGVEIAVVDDGVAYGHPDLTRNSWINHGEAGAGKETNAIDDDGNGYVDDTRGWDFADGDHDPRPVGEEGDHGTHVAGTIGAAGDNSEGITGVAWQTELMPLRVFDALGATTSAKIVSAFAYAEQNGAEVVNGSFGGGGFSQAELDSISGAAGTLFVVAAGNDGRDNDAHATYPCSYEIENLVCIAASDQSDALASFSNYGRTTVDMAAPGTNILSTYPEELTPPGYLPYAFMGGTSMAAPMVSGAAALLFARTPDAPAVNVAARLRETVDPLPWLDGKVVTGGRLNVSKALGAQTPAPEPSIPPATPAPPEESPAEPPPPEEPAIVSPDDTDVVPPETRVIRGPKARTRDRTPKFRFVSSEPAGAFRCRIDDKRFKPCLNPYTAPRLSRGRHAFRVVATDAADNRDTSPASDRFRIVAG